MAIAPGTYDMTIQRRSDHNVSISCTDKDGAVINMSGYSIASQVWDSGRTSKAADVTCTFTNQTNGVFDWKVTDTQTTTFTSDEYKYDLLVTDPTGLKEYWLEGTIYMDEGYTA